jgi:hypothetical protein
VLADADDAVKAPAISTRPAIREIVRIMVASTSIRV